MAEKRGGDFGASWVASGDLSAAQFRFVTFSGKDVYLPTSGVIVAGVLQDKPKDNDHAAVIGLGFTKIILASSLGGGAEIMAATSGFAALPTSGAWVGGFLLTAGDSGEITEAMLSPYRKDLS